ncbi:MAG: hypothetical protein LZF60_230101 [Nitrospira sp.]|nr:MAG: hypothetical protein LZF60_230101 [Nitrospira sp.]
MINRAVVVWSLRPKRDNYLNVVPSLMVKRVYESDHMIFIWAIAGGIETRTRMNCKACRT